MNLSRIKIYNLIMSYYLFIDIFNELKKDNYLIKLQELYVLFFIIVLSNTFRI